jgi:hypothetical protein
VWKSRCKSKVGVNRYFESRPDRAVSKRPLSTEPHENSSVIFEVFTAWLWRKQSSGMWHRVDMVLTDVSEERIASISQSASNVSHGRFAWGLSYNFPSTLKMEAIRSSETSVNTISTRYHIPEDCFLQFCYSYRLFALTAYALYRWVQKMWTHFSVQNICLNNLLIIHIWCTQKGMAGTSLACRWRRL